MTRCALFIDSPHGFGNQAQPSMGDGESKPPAGCPRTAPQCLRAGAAMALLLIAPAVPAVETIALRAGDITFAGATIHDAEIGYDLAGDRLTLSVARVALGMAEQPPVTDLRLTCTKPTLAGAVRGCEGAEVSANWPPLGTVSFQADIAYQPASGAVDVTLQDLPVGDGRLRIAAHDGPEGWRINLQGQRLPASRLAGIAGRLPQGWQVGGGTLSVNATVSATPGGIMRSAGEINAEALAWNNATGLQAAEGLAGRFGWAARHNGADWHGQGTLSLPRGQIYSDPVFIDFAGQPLTVNTDVVAPGDFTSLRLERLRLEHAGVAEGQGELEWESGAGITQARFQPLTLHLPAAYERYAQPFLVGTPAGALTTAGKATLTLDYAGGEPQNVSLSLESVDLAAGQQHGIRALTGRLRWRAEPLEPPSPSKVRMAGGRLYGVDVGATEVTLRLHGDGLSLQSPARIPILDGALEINRLALDDLTTETPSGEIDARIAPISLGELTPALGWPRFAGSLSGRLPTLRYADGVATLGGALTLQAFQGEIRVSELALTDPLGTLPRLTADVGVEGLDLETLTRAFEFGRITGTLDGMVTDLRLLAWEPASFRAWFHTPEHDPVRHRISQRAIQALSDIGGSGAAGALSRGFLQVFEDFGYRRLGLGCALENDVCLMRGVAPAETGYYIVEGAGLPRVDVIGHAQRVSWSTLIEQIKSVTGGRQPVVQ